MALQRRMQVLDAEKKEGAGITSETIGLKVAFATTDMKTVNQHFGSARSLAIYVVNPDTALIQEVMEFGKLTQNGNEDKLGEKIAALEGCAAVYSQAIGSSAMQKLIQKGIQPIKIHEGASIAALIDALQAEMKAGPSSWLAKAIEREKGPNLARFDEMEAEGWDE